MELGIPIDLWELLVSKRPDFCRKMPSLCPLDNLKEHVVPNICSHKAPYGEDTKLAITQKAETARTSGATR